MGSVILGSARLIEYGELNILGVATPVQKKELEPSVDNAHQKMFVTG